jgi:hypothetical protein
LGCIKHEEENECLHCWMWWTVPIVNITLFFVFWFQHNLFFTNRTCVRNALHDFWITLYLRNSNISIVLTLFCKFKLNILLFAFHLSMNYFLAKQQAVALLFVYYYLYVSLNIQHLGQFNVDWYLNGKNYCPQQFGKYALMWLLTYILYIFNILIYTYWLTHKNIQ